MDIHLVYAGYHYYSLVNYESRLKSFFLQGMKKYNIDKVMVSIIYMWRRDLITKENMLKRYNEKTYWDGFEDYRNKSVNDDLDSMFQDLCLGNVPDDDLYTYFLPQLTEKELDLVENKDKTFMKTFSKGIFADVKEAEMKASESDSKFVYGYGRRKTYILKIQIAVQ